MPGESKISPRRILAAEKQVKAMELRKAGATFREIGEKLGYTEAGARKAVMSALRKTLREPADELRTLEVERLDAMMQGLWPEALRGNPNAVTRVLNIMERRAKLLGLDAPAKVAPTNPEGNEAWQGLIIQYVDNNGKPMDQPSWSPE